MKKVSQYGIDTLDKLHKTMDGVMGGDKHLMDVAPKVATLANANARNMNSTLNGQRFDRTSPKGRTVKVKVSD